MPEFPLTGAPADWRDAEPRKTLIAAAEFLEGQGYTTDPVADAMLEVALQLSCRLHGPGAVAARLLKLAKLFAGEAGQHIAVTTSRVTH